MIYRIIFLGALFFIAKNHYGQTTHEAGILPSININKKLEQDWAINFRVESRHVFFDKTFNYNYILTDFSVAVSKKINLHSSVIFGYLLRTEKAEVSNRMFQQFNFIKPYNGITIGHRFGLDQTFSIFESPEFRFRYRITAEIPLKGQSSDPLELFIKFNNEYLNEIQSNIYDLEIRLAGYLGYNFNRNSKIELGIDYRLNSFIRLTPANRFWIGINYFQSL